MEPQVEEQVIFSGSIDATLKSSTIKETNFVHRGVNNETMNDRRGYLPNLTINLRIAKVRPENYKFPSFNKIRTRDFCALTN